MRPTVKRVGVFFVRTAILCGATLAIGCFQGVASAQSVVLRIDASKPSRPISPFIYGSCQADWATNGKYLTFGRIGGNRMTAYNWETNASNAGNDWRHQNDDFLGGGDVPGEVMRKAVLAAQDAGKAFVVTVPMAGYVAADKLGNGDVNQTPDYLGVRFVKSYPKKNAPYQYPPDLKDKAVYQDEFVWWLEKTRRPTPPVFYCLDNEPDIWFSTHARIHPNHFTYAEMVERTTALASAIKDVAPKALVFGFVSYGWHGFDTLQDAPDQNGRNFIEYFLTEMKKAEAARGRRLVDVLDLHWYPEARGNGKRITDGDLAPASIEARVQAPRSLWDPTYVEDSWIADSTGKKPIRLLPLIQERIARCYPGTKLAITEYNYGAGNHISGGVAEADVLGIFGREGVFAASLWGGDNDAFIYGGFDMFRNYDGKGGAFGDRSLDAQSSDVARATVYASADSKDPNRIVIVVINKAATETPARVTLTGERPFRSARTYRLTQASPHPVDAGEVAVKGSELDLKLPPLSVTTIVLRG